jgi:hypothetical protein
MLYIMKGIQHGPLETLQGKDLLAEVSNVTKLTKIVKTTSTTTFIFNREYFCEYYNKS